MPKQEEFKIAPRKGSENHQKGETGKNIQDLRNHAESSIHTKEVHTRPSLLPDHPFVSQDLTMKLLSLSYINPKENRKGKWGNKMS
jgi:hypothetical protein